MAKSGLIAVKPSQPVRPDGKLQRSNCILNQFIATALAEKVRKGEPMFTKEQWEQGIPTVLRNGEEVYEVYPKTYNSWMVRDTIIPEMGVTLRNFIERAREERRMTLHREQQDEIVREAQSIIAQIQKLPIGTKSTLTKKKYRIAKMGERYQSGEEVEIQENPVDPRMVSEKRRGAEYILDRLDPAYSPKSENKNLTVHVSLKDLRKAAEAKKQRADYEQ